MARSIIQIFRAGRHIPMSGQPIELTEADLERTARAYNRTNRRAPLVLGHPKNDRPAYGTVHELFAAGSALFADVEPEEDLKQWVRSGLFKKISASFFTPGSPANPSPGVFGLKHVGFLGAATPAVKGMLNPAFAEASGVLAFADGSAAGEVVPDLDRPAVNRIEALQRASGGVLTFDQAARSLGR